MNELEAALERARADADTNGHIPRLVIPVLLRLIADAYDSGRAQGILTLGPAGDYTFFRLEGRTT